MRRSHCTVLAALLLLAGTSAAMYHHPFIVRDLSWDATDVVVVTEAERIDGDVSVLEVWWGGLKPGAQLRLPALAAFASESARQVYITRITGRETIGPGLVSGRRMVLFLRQVDGRWEPAARSGIGTWRVPPRRRFSTGERGFRISTAWIQSGEVFAFGPAEFGIGLRSIGLDESALAKRLRSVTESRILLERIEAIPEDDERAAIALRFAGSIDHHLARFQALGVVRGCGPAGARRLRAALLDPTYADARFAIIETLEKIGGAEVGADLTAFLNSELEFWKEMAPKLARGTPSAKTISWDRERVLELRLATIRVAIRTLEKLCYEECVDVVLEHLDFWRTTPKMILQGQRSTVDQCHRTLRVFIGPH